MRFCLFFALHILSVIGYAAVPPAFTRIDPSYSSRKEEIEVKNIPRITSQDGFGVCYAHVAATMLQSEYCRTMKRDCAGLPEAELFSPLDLTRYRATDRENPSNLRSSYEGLQVDGGNVHNVAIIGGLTVGKAANEECLSLDRILSKMNKRGDTFEAQAALWRRIQQQYESVKKSAKEKEGCAECLNNIYATAVEKIQPEIDQNLNLRADNVKIAKAFAADTYEKFLDEFLGASQCRRASQMVFFEGREGVKYEFSKVGSLNAKQAKEKIKDVLKTGRPLAIGNICLSDEAPANCNADKTHGAVLAGFRTVCNSSGKCRDSFKVINSWGKSWQDQNDGGWVDADSLLNHTNLGAESLGWFEDKK